MFCDPFVLIRRKCWKYTAFLPLGGFFKGFSKSCFLRKKNELFWKAIIIFGRSMNELIFSLCTTMSSIQFYQLKKQTFTTKKVFFWTGVTVRLTYFQGHVAQPSNNMIFFLKPKTFNLVSKRIFTFFTKLIYRVVLMKPEIWLLSVSIKQNQFFEITSFSFVVSQPKIKNLKLMSKMFFSC